jgi:hypothetical protein
MDSLDQLWADLLSGDAPSIQRAWNRLSARERQALLAHLERMRDGPGWHATQRESAAAALAVLRPAAPPTPPTT